MTGSRKASARPLIGADVVVVDVETTGWPAGQATIIEIGAVRLSGRQVTGEFFSLVSPGPRVPCPTITELTGITDAWSAGRRRRRRPGGVPGLRQGRGARRPQRAVRHGLPDQRLPGPAGWPGRRTRCSTPRCWPGWCCVRDAGARLQAGHPGRLLRAPGPRPATGPWPTPRPPARCCSACWPARPPPARPRRPPRGAAPPSRRALEPRRGQRLTTGRRHAAVRYLALPGRGLPSRSRRRPWSPLSS